MSWLLILVGFLMGSIPFGVLLTRWRRGVDVRTQGSGNIGATNVARVAGKKLGILVLALDAAKAAAPVAVAVVRFPGQPTVHAAVGAAAFLGHVYPPWLGFRGGKGVAAAMGSLAVLLPLVAMAGFVAYGVVLFATRLGSLASLAGGLTAVASAFALNAPREYRFLTVGLFVFMVWTHRKNIRRLLAGSERSV